MKRLLLLAMSLITFSQTANAYIKWKLVPEQSKIAFTATQNNVPVKGSFKKFTADIRFDRFDLKHNDVRIVVDMSSLATPIGDMTSLLATKDWFDIADYKTAVFTASQFTKSDQMHYSGQGELTIRDRTVPVTLDFAETTTDEQKQQHRVRITGSTILKRSDFDVGLGEWRDTKVVKDEVKLDFEVTVESQ